MSSPAMKSSRSRSSSYRSSYQASRNQACNLPRPRQQQTHKAQSGAPHLPTRAQKGVNRGAHVRAALMAALMSSPSAAPTSTRLRLQKKLQAKKEAVQDMAGPCTGTACISVAAQDKAPLTTRGEPTPLALPLPPSLFPSPTLPTPPPTVKRFLKAGSKAWSMMQAKAQAVGETMDAQAGACGAVINTHVNTYGAKAEAFGAKLSAKVHAGGASIVACGTKVGGAWSLAVKAKVQACGDWMDAQAGACGAKINTFVNTHGAKAEACGAELRASVNVYGAKAEAFGARVSAWFTGRFKF